MALLRRALVALGLAALVAAVLRLRGIGRHAAAGRRLARAVGPGSPVVRALVIGAGAVGARAVRQLVESPEVDEVAIVDTDPARQAAIVAQLRRQGPTRHR